MKYYLKNNNSFIYEYIYIYRHTHTHIFVLFFSLIYFIVFCCSLFCSFVERTECDIACEITLFNYILYAYFVYICDAPYK